MSVAKSFFNITTGRNHGIPAADAVRTVLDSGAALLLDKLPRDGGGPKMIRAAAISPAGDDKGGLRLTFDIMHVVTEDRVDKALSALVEKMILGEAGVEVTEWTVPWPGDTDTPHIQFGRHGVPLFTPKSEDDILGLLLGCVKVARQDRDDRIHAVVVRIQDRAEVGIMCLLERPEPPVGATLTGRRMIGGAPWADVPWMQVAASELGGNERYGLIRRAIAKVKHDCGLAGLDLPSRVPKLSLIGADGQRLAHGPEISWVDAEEDSSLLKLGRVVKEMTASSVNRRPVEVPESLRVTAVQRED